MRDTPSSSSSSEGSVAAMEVGESALDVLSRAASLVTSGVKPAGRWNTTDEKQTKLKHQDARVASLRDYRIRTLKRRKKQRNHEYITAKLKARRTTSTQTSMTLMADSSPDEEVANVTCSSRTSNDGDDDDTSDKEDADNMPLDMTTTKRKETCKENCLPETTMLRKCLLTTNPTPPSLRSSGLDGHRRPSVITCSSSSSSFCKDGDKKTRSSAGRARKKSGSDVRTGHRREVLSGMCDPVIDEHFRRSLGKDYSEVFSTAPVSSSSSASSTSTVSVCGLSVDDHFAKALGDIWLQLQKKAHSSSNSSPAPSLSPELAPPVSPLIQQC